MKKSFVIAGLLLLLGGGVYIGYTQNYFFGQPDRSALYSNVDAFELSALGFGGGIVATVHVNGDVSLIDLDTSIDNGTRTQKTFKLSKDETDRFIEVFKNNRFFSEEDTLKKEPVVPDTLYVDITLVDKKGKTIRSVTQEYNNGRTERFKAISEEFDALFKR